MMNPDPRKPDEIPAYTLSRKIAVWRMDRIKHKPFGLTILREDFQFRKL